MKAPQVAAIAFAAENTTEDGSLVGLVELIAASLLLLSGIWYFSRNKKQTTKETRSDHEPILQLEQSTEKLSTQKPSSKRFLILTNSGSSTAYDVRIKVNQWDSATKCDRNFARIRASHHVKLGPLKAADHCVEIVVKYATADDKRHETRLQWPDPDQ
ncbi:hypothetical protein [Pseudarthrobacter sp. PS3-L1]|uniref:hypothetical protein n=1 Tax=Pseudarthrobacter sp. PS3-L1 TaxID=3046207 RepID=UPI0024B90B07|nr:hypothetical protein [Pseudarthrobacter sp. PS3-L1]MDJ0318941.1 hypothetical protein [Pseudarthrobacter sp. PS3-L1]